MLLTAEPTRRRKGPPCESMLLCKRQKRKCKEDEEWQLPTKHKKMHAPRTGARQKKAGIQHV